LNPNQTPLQISSTDLQLDSEGLAMAVQTLALDAIAKPQSRSFRPGVAKPAAVSVPLRPPRIHVNSFVFDEPATVDLPPRRPNPAVSESVSTPPKPRNHTRIKPPGDIVKLWDRLFYALQPPLEMMVDTGELHFPFEPFPYQYAGIAFLFPRYAAVLADEMGLGKTMQAISTIRMLIRSGEVRSVLVICPKPLVTNWKREFSMWAPEISLDIIEGDQARREFQWQQPMAVKVANYELITRDKEMVASLGLQFDLVVLDEAQRIKNRSSATSQAVRDLDRTRSWALTGTPVENSPEDLVGIFEFVSPGYLRSEMKPRTMGKATKDYVLRRTKDMVLTDLPPKMYRDAELDLSASQWESYERAESGGVLRLSEMGDELTIQHVFELVLRLKQVCNFDPVTNESSKLDRLEADMEEVAASGKKAIVFSQWVKTLKKIKDRLGRFGTLEYHGKIPSRKREHVIDQFRNDDSQHVILMSYGAGSVGLNLQFCEYVFLFDRWWNPAVEDQAINRAHRIGAAGPVTVTRMLCLNTIEQRIHSVLEEKRELFATIFSETDAPASMGLSQEDIFGLFNLKTGKRDAD
jgi:SNF2 family DNA or RNA helicase